MNSGEAGFDIMLESIERSKLRAYGPQRQKILIVRAERSRLLQIKKAAELY